MSIATLTRPRVMHVPESVSSAGAEAVDLARMAGLDLDPWQQLVIEHGLAERADGKWAAFEVGINVPRQNGKGGILEARELAGLFLLGERLIIHSAHEFATSLEAFRRLLMLIEDTPELAQRVTRVSRAHGEEGISLRGGQRIRFRTRTKGGGRGFSADCVILDEAMILQSSGVAALIPTLSARPNPQIWYAGSAVDQVVHEHGVVWARVRERGLAGADRALAYFEWSADPGDQAPDPSALPEGFADDPETWAQANPALGIRIDPEHVENERRAMDPRTFAVERLGIGDWPETDPEAGSVIPIASWRALIDPGSQITGPIALAFDVTPDRSSSAITAAGRREDGLLHVEVVDHRPGTRWLPERLAQLERDHDIALVACDGASPAASLIEAVEDEGPRVVRATSADMARACGHFFDAVADGSLRHPGGPGLDSAIRGAAQRPLVDSWAWSRKSSKVDISPLVAATLGVWHAAVAPAQAWAEAVSMPRWIGRMLYAMRGKRRVRLHLEVKADTPVETIEGVLVGRWSGHYILLLPRVLRDEGTSTSLEGEVEVPAERVIFVQVLR